MTYEFLLDEVEYALAGHDEPVTLEQIFESEQSRYTDRLTESDRRRIRRKLYRYRRDGLIVKDGQGRYRAPFSDYMGKLGNWCGTSGKITYMIFQSSVMDFISDRRGEAFALRDAYGLSSPYDDIVRHRYMIRRFIGELCESGRLETVGSRMYRATASFQDGHDGPDTTGSESGGRLEGTA